MPLVAGVLQVRVRVHSWSKPHLEWLSDADQKQVTRGLREWVYQKGWAEGVLEPLVLAGREGVHICPGGLRAFFTVTRVDVVDEEQVKRVVHIDLANVQSLDVE